MAEATENHKVLNPRVEIDTSPPFESVKEAVDRFGGSGPWIPLHLLRLAAAGHAFQHEIGGFNADKIEEQAVQLERDLLQKEHETHDILEELEAAKKFVQQIKTTLVNPVAVPDQHSSPILSPGLMFMELNQAKMSLSKTSVDLALIQESVESLNQKMQREKLLLEQRSKVKLPPSEGMLSLEQNNHMISGNKLVLDQKAEKADNPALYKDLEEVNFEAEQFKKMTEASRYEVIKAMADIERIKYSIRMAEMRLTAAKKMEEAAKAVEAIALAQGNAVNGCQDSSDGITLSFQEYQQQVDDLCKTKFVDTNAIHQTDDPYQLDVPVLEKFEEVVREENTQPRQRRSNITANLGSAHVHHPCTMEDDQDQPRMTSLGNILSRKFILQDDDMRAEHRPERQHISLSQMLREQSRVILHSPKRTAEHAAVEKQYFVQRKKFGFINVPLPSKQSKKKKTHPVNVR